MTVCEDTADQPGYAIALSAHVLLQRDGLAGGSFQSCEDSTHSTHFPRTNTQLDKMGKVNPLMFWITSLPRPAKVGFVSIMKGRAIPGSFLRKKKKKKIIKLELPVPCVTSSQFDRDLVLSC